MKNGRPVVLGINAVFHESAAAVVVDGEPAAAVEEERFTRIKHAKKATPEGVLVLPWRSIDHCLEAAGLTPEQVDRVAYSFYPYDRYPASVSPPEDGVADGDYGSETAERRLFQLVRLTSRILERAWSRDLEGAFVFVPHHLCHAASACFCSGWDEAAILVVDGIGETASTSLGFMRGGKVEIIDSIHYPHSLGFLWEKITAWLGFRRNNDECKVMGLAAYGDPARFRSAFASIVRIDEQAGAFMIDDSITRFRRENDFGALDELFGRPARRPWERLLYEGDDSFHADVAAALQEVTERALLALARRLARETGMSRLVMAGGVALNCVANGKLIEEGVFEDVWIQPAAHDAGTALGAACYVLHEHFGGASPAPFSVYCGPAFDRERCRSAARAYGLRPMPEAREHEDGGWVGFVADRLCEGYVVGWFHGALEFGPRALGHRSILADPRNPGMKDLLNRRIKHREVFRPFAPSVAAEHVAEWFELPRGRGAAADRYMLTAYRVKEERRTEIPAVVHVDGTSRLQVVYSEDDPLFHSLLLAFGGRTGVPMLLNTSFNDREPIVCTPEDALRCFLSSGVDFLVMEGDVYVHPSLECKERPRRGAMCELVTDRIDGERGLRLQFCFKGHGCTHWLETGGCTNCAFPESSTKGRFVFPRDLIEQFDAALDGTLRRCGGDVAEVDVFCSGSFFNDREVPPSVRRHVARRVAAAPGVRKLMVETRPEFVRGAAVDEMLDLLGENVTLEVALGLESSDEYVREEVIRKRLPLPVFEDAVRILRSRGVDLLVYVLLKPYPLSELEAVEDVLATASYLERLAARLEEEGAWGDAAATLALEPVFVQEGGRLERLYELGRYRPPRLWSVLYLLLRMCASSDPTGGVELPSPFGAPSLSRWELQIGMPVDSPEPLAVASNCEECTTAWWKFFEEFNGRGLSSLEAWLGGETPAADADAGSAAAARVCSCLGDWTERMRGLDGLDAFLSIIRAGGRGAE